MKLAARARQTAQRLKTLNLRVVFAESCTAGLVSSQLAAVPGISEFHCGSLVTYRNRSKQDWLAIPRDLLDSPGPVSEIVARRMALGALRLTGEADVAASVTGHLGPAAPEPLDGLIFIGVATRTSNQGKPHVTVTEHHLRTSSRHQRQREAAGLVFSTLCETLGNHS